MVKTNSFYILKSVAHRGELDKTSLMKLKENRKLIDNVLHLAEINGLYYLFVINLKRLGLDLTTEERFKLELAKLDEFKKTLKLLNDISNKKKIDHILIKSCIDIPHVPRDVDILIHSKQKDEFIEALLEKGLRPVYLTDVETALSKGGYLKIDIYTETRYMDYTFLDELFLWNSVSKTRIFGEEHWMLNNEANLLLLMVHSVFGHRNITFLDYIQINYNLSKTKLTICRDNANEKGWIQTFNVIYSEFIKIKTMVESSSYETLYFPYKFDNKFILESIRGLNNKQITKKFLIILYVSLLIDGLIHELRKYKIYSYLLKYSWIRIAFNSFNYFIRHSVGDTKSK